MDSDFSPFYGRFFGEVPGQHELGLEHRATGVNPPIQRRRHPFMDGMRDPLLHVSDGIAGVTLIPAPVELFRLGSELDGSNCRKDLLALEPYIL
jgi:hypothetical protein